MSGQASIFIKDIRSIVQKTVSHTNRLRIHWYSLDAYFCEFCPSTTPQNINVKRMFPCLIKTCTCTSIWNLWIFNCTCPLKCPLWENHEI